MTTLHRRSAWAAALGLALVLAGCGSAGTTGDPTSAGPTETATTATPTGPRTVTDMAGREVAIPAEVISIGTFGSVGVLNAFVQLMGAGDKITNQMPANFTSSDQWKMQYEFSPQIADGPLFEEGGEVMVETVLAAAPDVAFTMTKETATILENVGVPAVYLEWNDVADVKDAVVLVGDVLGVPDRAQEYLTYFDEHQAAAQKLMADLPEDDRLSVLYGDPIQFRQPHVIAEWWITQAGGKSVTDNGRNDNSAFEYTMEDLLAWNPQVIILSNDKLRAEIDGNANYANIAAVKDGKIHAIPTVAHVWGNRTVEQPLTVLWTMHHLYPDLMPRAELAEEIEGFYATFFEYRMSAEQIEAIIDR